MMMMMMMMMMVMGRGAAAAAAAAADSERSRVAASQSGGAARPIEPNSYSSWIAIQAPARPRAPRRLLLLSLSRFLAFSLSRFSAAAAVADPADFHRVARRDRETRLALLLHLAPNLAGIGNRLHPADSPGCSCRTVRARNCAKFLLSLAGLELGSLIADAKIWATLYRDPKFRPPRVPGRRDSHG
jgi:hypothetical protein